VAKRTSTIRYKSVRQSHNDRNAIAWPISLLFFCKRGDAFGK
jgi:hypothetical protein